jgi:hypothetical protein
MVAKEIAKEIAQEQESDAPERDPQPEIIFPPIDLYSNEPPLETDFHRLQMTLLLQCIEWLWHTLFRRGWAMPLPQVLQT